MLRQSKRIRLIPNKTEKNMNSIKRLLSALLVLMIALPMAAQSERTIKRKVAIGRFSNETQ